ncbi:response regulator transcription factor [Patulibacter defluvii]|uniref:response regulator transcription factor n=1 Tax=Patulibacter defluvii TaxID=3095358 RepID=UPI002A75832A|nr:response regulator transcription factor [Patulibacter sp. DM4]
MPDSKVRVLVAEDHPLFAEVLTRLIAGTPGLEVALSTGDGREAWEALRDGVADVAVLDLRLPGMSGLEILRAVRRDELPVRVLILSAEATGETVFDAVRLGVDGYVVKESARQEVTDAIAAVIAGRTIFSPGVQAILAAEVRGRRHEQRTILSPREQEILRGIAEGLSGPEIARRLQIGTATVKTHTRNVYEKLGVADRAAAVAEAMRQGLIE